MADNRLNVKSPFPDKTPPKKTEIHVFDTGLKTLWENDFKGSDRQLL